MNRKLSKSTVGTQRPKYSSEFAHMFIGLAYTHLENWELGYQNYERALKFIGDEESPILTDIYSNEAYCLSKMGRYEEAHQICRKSKGKDARKRRTLSTGRIYLSGRKRNRLSKRVLESCHTLCPRSGNTDTNRQLLSKLQYVGEMHACVSKKPKD